MAAIGQAEPQRSLRCHFAFMSASVECPRFFNASSTPSKSRSWILRLSPAGFAGALLPLAGDRRRFAIKLSLAASVALLSQH